MQRQYEFKYIEYKLKAEPDAYSQASRLDLFKSLMVNVDSQIDRIETYQKKQIEQQNIALENCSKDIENEINEFTQNNQIIHQILIDQYEIKFKQQLELKNYETNAQIKQILSDLESFKRVLEEMNQKITLAFDSSASLNVEEINKSKQLICELYFRLNQAITTHSLDKEIDNILMDLYYCSQTLFKKAIIEKPFARSDLDFIYRSAIFFGCIGIFAALMFLCAPGAFTLSVTTLATTPFAIVIGSMVYSVLLSVPLIAVGRENQYKTALGTISKAREFIFYPKSFFHDTDHPLRSLSERISSAPLPNVEDSLNEISFRDDVPGIS